MATRIVEYGGLVGYAPNIVPASQEVAVQPAMTATTDGTNRSAPFNAATSIVLVQSDEEVSVA